MAHIQEQTNAWHARKRLVATFRVHGADAADAALMKIPPVDWIGGCLKDWNGALLSLFPLARAAS